MKMTSAGLLHLIPPDHKLLDLSELKAFADNKIIIFKLIFVFERIENMAGKENPSYDIFSSSTMFPGQVPVHRTRWFNPS